MTTRRKLMLTNRSLAIWGTLACLVVFYLMVGKIAWEIIKGFFGPF